MKRVEEMKGMKRTGMPVLFFTFFIAFTFFMPPFFMPPFFMPAPRAQGVGEVPARIETEQGTIAIVVDVGRAPITAGNFLKYVDAGIYDDGRFYRVTRPDNYTPNPPDKPAMEIIQGGIDPSRRRELLPPIPLERTSVTGLKHVAGTVSMARSGPDSATTEFFILLDDQPSLDFGGKRFDDAQGAAAFGHVVAGMEVVRKIQQMRPMQERNPQYLVTPVKILRISREKK